MEKHDPTWLEVTVSRAKISKLPEVTALRLDRLAGATISSPQLRRPLRCQTWEIRGLGTSAVRDFPGHVTDDQSVIAPR